MSDDNLWKSLSFVMRSKNRIKVMKALVVPQTPLSASKKTNLNIKSVSRALIELSKENLVICKTPNAKKGRIYVLTDKGKKLLKYFRESDTVRL